MRLTGRAEKPSAGRRRGHRLPATHGDDKGELGSPSKRRSAGQDRTPTRGTRDAHHVVLAPAQARLVTFREAGPKCHSGWMESPEGENT